MEHSDRGGYVTGYVSMWICNDGDHIEKAREVLRIGSALALGRFLSKVLRIAPWNSAAWHTARELAHNDYDRIDWDRVAEDLTGE